MRPKGTARLHVGQQMLEPGGRAKQRPIVNTKELGPPAGTHDINSQLFEVETKRLRSLIPGPKWQHHCLCLIKPRASCRTKGLDVTEKVVSVAEVVQQTGTVVCISFRRQSRLTPGGKSHTEALLQHMKDQNISNYGCSVKPQVHF